MINMEKTAKYYIVDDNNNGFWQESLSPDEVRSLIYNPATDVYHTKRNYNDYKFMNCTSNPRLKN